MKATLTLIILLILLCACGGGGGGKSIPEPEPWDILASHLEAIVGDYTWEGTYWHSSSQWDVIPIGPYDGHIELIGPGCIRIVVEMPDRDCRIDVRLYARNGEQSDNCDGSQWQICSDPYWPQNGYSYDFQRTSGYDYLVSIGQWYHRDGEGIELFLLAGVRQ